MKGGIDSDYAWLKTHLQLSKGMPSRELLARKITTRLNSRIRHGTLPYTLGIFGGWGTGKTTLLAMLAENLEQHKNRKVVYFNSWKYAGFMEIVPALIYKILQFGAEGANTDRDEAARRVILALGKKYSDQIGDWAKTKIGVNPVELFKDLYDISDTVQRGVSRAVPEVMPQVVRAYYTQVDKAQDELRRALGIVVSGTEPKNVVVVLIDELDRCDPDEAFNVIKQMRVLFGMRDLPVAFVIAANAEPIGLAIKHRYGLESDTSDYEARRILEKFVDSYEDLSAAESLGPLIQEMWQKDNLPWIIQADEANETPEFNDDVVKNASAFDAITTSVPLFSNIRVLHKSYEHVRNNSEINRHLLWTKWLLEIANQIDPRFRRDLRTLTGQIEKSASLAYKSLHGIGYQTSRVGRFMKIEYESGQKGNTLFSIFRTFFWEHAREELERIRVSKDPEDIERSIALQKLLSDPLRVDVVVLLSLLPFERVPSFEALCREEHKLVLPDFSEELETLIDEFGNCVAS
jgi:hypothetical protein